MRYIYVDHVYHCSTAADIKIDSSWLQCYRQFQNKCCFEFSAKIATTIDWRHYDRFRHRSAHHWKCELLW